MESSGKGTLGPSGAADAVFVNGDIWTGVAEAERAEALAIRGEEILAVGSNEEIEKLRDAKTKMVDLDGRFVSPGFIDSHTHFLNGGLGLASVNLRDAASPEEFSRRLHAFTRAIPKGRWILRGDWDHELWGGALPTRDWIDGRTADNPVFVSRLDGHMALANTLALDLAGITADTPDPKGGVIVRDEAGRPTGVFKDAAMDLVRRVIPAPTTDELDEAFDRAAGHALAHGVTMIHDVANLESLEVFRRARARGTLDLRAYAATTLQNWRALKDYVDENGRGDEWLQWGGVKGFVDGSLGSSTAWFHEPYTDAPETSGIVMHDLDDFREWMRGADEAGLQLFIHAIGDRANDWLLDEFEAIQRSGAPRDRRFRIEHTQHLTAEAINGIAALNVIASMQPFHAIDDGRWAERRIGPERIKLTYAFKSLLDAEAHVAFGSDWTVAPINPLYGIYAAVTRRTIDGANPGGWVPEQKISVEQAMIAYTSSGAYAAGLENRLGTLEAGKAADFVVLSGDPFETAPEMIKDLKVLRTVVGGDQKYVAP